ncbi:hypothetical protein C483_02291 [Natrialba hulunbeirensis JCM 10989]|uniref:Uncharacterized protein n=1 Tax=Natrialba hulunbeirensis JCM 10989 TaxID=1227493 RepID=M0A9U6_9EURY|nr:hypothetical protein [Natrialba hulunbeirensis]ELY95156.1 hypothetical protein C483_02291 [Natrialba hulunbeirensis JCM 10989]
MGIETIKETTKAYFKEDIDEGRNIYLNQYYASKELTKTNIQDLFQKLGTNENELSFRETEGDEHIVRVNSSPILLWSLSEERWLIAYSSSTNKSLRNKLSDIHNRVGWMLDVSFEGDKINDLYQSYTPKDESVSIERRWDPYWIYQHDSDIPDHLHDYYFDNINEFVEQEIEFNLKTPRWLVDNALKEGVQKDLLEKSEISRSRFEYQIPPESDFRQDGGVQASSPSSRVTIRQEGQVVHRTGSPSATFHLFEELESQRGAYDELEEVIPKREYEENEHGIIQLKEYRPPRVLKLVFTEKEYTPEASIKLSNLLTVGQSDVDLYGVVKGRDDLEFLAETNTPFDEGRFEIFFTSVEEPDSEPRPALYIKPVTASTASLTYLYNKIKEKYDPRVREDIIDIEDMDIMTPSESGSDGIMEEGQ